MSYEIIRSIKIKNGKVFLCSTANNVRPYSWNEWKCSSLTKILVEQGREALDLEILREYESGNLQRGKNKYTRALEVLRHFPEYKDFDWRGEPYDLICRERKTSEFTDLLKRALRTPLPKDKFIIHKPYNQETVYLRFARRVARWSYEKARAKIFRYAEDAEALKKCFYNSDNWQVERLTN